MKGADLETTESIKDRIYKTAISMFSARGFRGTSIRDIANDMNISMSNIYHHFGNKEGLLLAILQRVSERLVKDLKDVTTLDLPPVDKLEKLVDTHIRLAGTYTKETRIFFLDEEHLSKEGEKINRNIQRQIFGFYKSVLSELDEAGLIHYRSINVLAFNIFGVINWQLRWYRSDGSLSLEEVKEEIVSFIMNGVLGGAWEHGDGEDIP
jgi:TetR/AcrR family transcriptional regulator, cholesterol catabolism regulator